MNIMKIMKQAQEVQAKLGAVQADMETREFEGNSGGNAVKVSVTGKGELKKISIDPSLLVASEKEMLEDLIIAAHNDAKKKADGALSDAMSGATGDLKLPGGFKLPF